MSAVLVTLPLPPKELSPNSRSHWGAKHKAAQAARFRACVVTRNASPPMAWESATVEIVWYAKTRMHPDADNALASIKAYLDGLQDAGLIENDRGLAFQPITWAVDRANPRVELRITPMREAA